jgi:hypothetical protein
MCRFVRKKELKLKEQKSQFRNFRLSRVRLGDRFGGNFRAGARLIKNKHRDEPPIRRNPLVCYHLPPSKLKFYNCRKSENNSTNPLPQGFTFPLKSLNSSGLKYYHSQFSSVATIGTYYLTVYII